MRHDKRARFSRYVLWAAWLPALLCVLCGRSGAQTATHPSANPTPPAIRAAAAIVVDAKTGATLFAKNPDKRLPPASTTKMMTALLLARRVPPNARIVASPNAAATPELGLGMRPGESFTCRDLLHAMLLVSANDAAVAAAEHLAGTSAQFAQQMNAEAQAMGAANTHFTNPSGLPDPHHVSTARDLAAIARQAVRNPLFNAVARTRTYRVPRDGGRPPTLLTNKDSLLWSFPGADGIKTGYTQEAGYCFVGSATRGGRRLITVVLHSPDWQGETAALLRYGFACAASSPNAEGPHPRPTPNPLPKGKGPIHYSSPPLSLGEGSGVGASPPSQRGTSDSGKGAGGLGLPSPILGGGGLSRKGRVAPGTLRTRLGKGKYGPKTRGKKGYSSAGGPQAGRVEPPADWAKRPQGENWPRFTSIPPPTPKIPWHWLGLLLLFLIACLLLRQLARLWGNAMTLPKLFPFFRRRSERKPEDTRPRPGFQNEVPTASPSVPTPASDFIFTMPPIHRFSGLEWLQRLSESPTRLLEPAARRQAAALVSAYPQEGRERLLGLLDSANAKIRVAAAELLAAIAPRRAEETLLAVLDDESAGTDVCADAVRLLAQGSGEKHEARWTQMLLRDGSAPAARALMDQPALAETTRHSLQRVLKAERPAGSAAAQKADFQAALAACVLGAHGLLSPEETAEALARVDAARQEPILASCLRGRPESWAVGHLVDAALRPHGYAALQALLESDPGLVRAALEAREETADAAERTRARTVQWLLLGEGDADMVRRLAETGDDLASGARKLERLHRWDLNEASPDALRAAAVIVSLRLGFSAHTPEQIAAALRAGAGGEEAAVAPAETPELEPISRAYAEPAVYDAVQAALHTEDGLSALLAALTRRPENAGSQEELAFWCDKMPSETRLLLTHALRGAQSEAARTALIARAGDPCLSVRSAALRLRPTQVPVGEQSSNAAPPTRTILLEPELSESMDKAA